MLSRTMSLTETINLHSIPSASGRKNALIISVILHFVTFILIVTAGSDRKRKYSVLDRSRHFFSIACMAASYLLSLMISAG